MSTQTVRPQLSALFAAAVAAVDPRQLIQRRVKVKRTGLLVQEGSQAKTFPLSGRVFVVGAGKGAGFLTQGLESELGERIAGGVVIVPSGHTVELGRVSVVNGEHPLPGPGSVSGTEKIAALLAQRQASDLICCCLTGGASSLLVSPAAGLSLDDKLTVNRLLLACGAAIQSRASSPANAVARAAGRAKRATRTEFGWCVPFAEGDENVAHPTVR